MENNRPILLRRRKRIRSFVKGTFGRLKSGVKRSADYQDLLWTSLTALETSSDAFPALKGVVGAVVAVSKISQRVKHSKKEARELAQRTVDLLERLADAIPDPTEISDHMLNNIARFESVLEEIQAEMSQLASRGLRWRLMHLNRNEDSLRKFNSLLDEASRGFLIGTVVRVEAAVHRVHTQMIHTSAGIAVLHDTEILLLRGLLLMQAALFFVYPRFGGLGGLLEVKSFPSPASSSFIP
ncbi:hypothetical protein C8F04DRAFT_1101597 [Mycena alexandri]|uniref:Uncharacterized protein n=1 Tax=Mycena alexandri TaxID=1745969 RepID=A0AAD6SWB2_9AGAR|nr:hypothetical protein C8F04DRAFT_1101597 [Mycena alexandri]